MLWALGIPLPLLVLIYLLRGCSDARILGGREGKGGWRVDRLLWRQACPFPAFATIERTSKPTAKILMKRKPATKRHSDSLGRPIWKGYVSFGLVQIPVVLHSAEAPAHELSFRMLDRRNNGRIKYQRVNESTGEEVPWNDIVKAYEYDDDNYVLITDEDFKRAAPQATQRIDIESFVKSEEISPLYHDKPYYLLPGKQGEKGYALLRSALSKTGRVGVARVVIRTREYLSMLMVEDKALVLMLMRFPQELRTPSAEDLPSADLKKNHISPKEVEMAEGLIKAMSDSWQPQKYHDEYRDAMMEWIEKKAKAGGVMPPAADEVEGPEPGAIINISDLLKKSLQQQTKATATGTRTTTTRRKQAVPVKRRKSA